MWRIQVARFAGAILLLAVTVGMAGCGRTTGSPSGTGLANADTPKAKGSVELTVSAAASLTDSLKQIKPLFEAAHPEIKLNLNYGGSGTLRAQIEQGAPVDLFVSADIDNMKRLADKGLMAKQTTLLRGELVAIVAVDAKLAVSSPDDLRKPDVRTIAIGEPQTVPAGSYAKEALTSLKLWDALQPKLVPAKDVRQVLTYVETGNADIGFVYRTDAAASSKTKVAFTLDPSTHRPIEYPMGLLQNSAHPVEAAELFAYLQGKSALDVFVQDGFSPAVR